MQAELPAPPALVPTVLILSYLKLLLHNLNTLKYLKLFILMYLKLLISHFITLKSLKLLFNQTLRQPKVHLLPQLLLNPAPFRSLSWGRLWKVPSMSCQTRVLLKSSRAIMYRYATCVRMDRLVPARRQSA